MFSSSCVILMSLEVYETQHSLIWVSIKSKREEWGRCTPWGKRRKINQMRLFKPSHRAYKSKLKSDKWCGRFSGLSSRRYQRTFCYRRFSFKLEWKMKPLWGVCRREREREASRWHKLIGRNWVRHRIDIETAVEIKQFIATPRRAIKLIILWRIRLTTSGPSTPALETVAPNHWFDLVSICSFRSLKLFPAIKMS